MSENKRKILLFISILAFGGLGVYFTFFASNINQYDSQKEAYRIDPNEDYDSDGNTTYHPTYYFKVRGREYKCEAKIGSSSYPNENKKTVYYDSSNPSKCKTEYDKSSGRLAGIICLIVSILMIYFSIPRKNNKKVEEPNQIQDRNVENQNQQIQENIEKINNVVDKVQIIYKRVIIGFFIIILLVLIAFDSLIFKQTLKSKDYIETTAVYVGTNEKEEDSAFVDSIYSFKDKKGNDQQIIISETDVSSAKSSIKIKYNEKDPQDFYDEGAILDKTEFIWFIVKVVLLILLIILFFNKKLLRKLGISGSLTKN